MKDALIGLPSAEYCLFKARGTGRADPAGKGPLTLACNISNEPER